MKSFPPYPEATPPLDMVDLPADLPAPVARYYQVTCGEQVPVIESAIITGRVRLRIRGLTFASRFRFTHKAGRDYRHYFEITVLGYPLMKVNEYYLDGKGRMELPFSVVEGEPKVDMAANLGLWGESFWLPSIFITHPRVRWEAIDDTTARLVVPFGGQEDAFTITFDPQTGLIQMMVAMRYKEAKDEEKTPWHIELQGWDTFHRLLLPSPLAVTWMDEGKPWAIFTLEDVAYNVDVSEYIRASGL